MFNKKASKFFFCQIVDTHFLTVQCNHNFSWPDMITELVLNCVIFIILHHHKNVKNKASLLATKESFWRSSKTNWFCIDWRKSRRFRWSICIQVYITMLLDHVICLKQRREKLLCKAEQIKNNNYFHSKWHLWSYKQS